jgi:hypothetical protein
MPPRTPGNPLPSPGPPPPGGITMLGAAQTGKTTFLAALQIALLRRPDLGWHLRGDNDGSTRALVGFINDITHGHIFPQPNVAIENYRWSLEAEVQAREWNRWWYRRRESIVRVPLDLVDAPGLAADGTQVFGGISERFVENLARSAGIVLIFDPVSEYERGDAFLHTYGVLARLSAQAARRGRLPHYVAVCIAKFDEIRVLRSAEAMRMVVQDVEKPEFPKVPEEYAAEFFERLARRSRSDSAELILPLLQQTFREDRIRFFVTSAIGFYVAPSIGVFDRSDFQNHIPGDEGNGIPNRIRGAIYPINVIEPVLWLGRSVARTAE